MSGARPRVLHAPVDVAGQATLAVAGLRAIGIPAAALCPPHPFGYATQPDIPRPASRLAFARVAAGAARAHDVVHFHFGASFLPAALRAADAAVLRRLGKRVVVEFHGSDIRMPSVERARNPHYVPETIEDDRAAVATMRAWSSVTGGHAILADAALRTFAAPYFTHLHVARQRVDVSSWEVAPPAERRRPVLVHAPSSPRIKGTAHVRRAVDELTARGVPLEYVEVHGLSHDEARRQFARADLIVDQLCIGSHGVVAIEAMSLGKPVVCFIHPAVRGEFPPDLPLIDADPTTITEVLADWLSPERAADRRALGLASRAYAEREHDLPVVARRLASAYAALPAPRTGVRARAGGR